MKEVFIWLQTGGESPYINKKIPFKVTDIVDLEQQLIAFFADHGLRDMLDDQGKLGTHFAYASEDKLYRDIKEIPIEDQTTIKIFLLMIDG